ncbi:MAG: hypothetical protein PHY42_07100 [Bacilli bacterium]|nr:hypothetical protein [Bacilli bacterium]
MNKQIRAIWDPNKNKWWYSATDVIMVIKNFTNIEKIDYQKAMSESPIDSKRIYSLLKNELTIEIENRELFLKGIDCSHYYEEVE